MNPLKKQKAKFKRNIARTTGIPTTKSGRKRKVNRLSQEFKGWVFIAAAVGIIYLLN